jgi:hypothetical protein
VVRILCLLALALAPPPAAAAADEPLQYQVTVAAGEVLEVEARFAAGQARLDVDGSLLPFLADLQVETAPGRWTALDGRQGQLPSGAVHLRYRFLLGRAADAIGDVDVAARCGQALVAPPGTWLVHPEVPRDRLRYRLAVTGGGASFASPLPAVGPDSYTSSFGPSGISPYAAFGRFTRERLPLGGGTVELAVSSPALDGDRAAVRGWVTTAARAVSAYFGRLPVPRFLVLVVPKTRGVHGKQMGDGEASVLLQIEPGADLHDRSWDWVATHEMVHLGAPSLPRRHLWLEEGLATYVEPLARAAVGDMDEATVWREMMGGMPKGQPEPGERGLDHTRTWASTYWGGALFFLEADLAIRRATGGTRSLRTALRAVVAAGGDARVWWSIDRFLSAADDAVGKPVLRPMYEKMALSRHEVDLPGLWARLGVVRTAGGVTFDDRAPEAALRRSLTRS